MLHTENGPETQNLINISGAKDLKQTIVHYEEKRWHKSLQIYEADHTISLTNVQGSKPKFYNQTGQIVNNTSMQFYYRLFWKVKLLLTVSKNWCMFFFSSIESKEWTFQLTASQNKCLYTV